MDSGLPERAITHLIPLKIVIDVAFTLLVLFFVQGKILAFRLEVLIPRTRITDLGLNIFRVGEYVKIIEGIVSQRNSHRSFGFGAEQTRKVHPRALVVAL